MTQTEFEPGLTGLKAQKKHPFPYSIKLTPDSQCAVWKGSLLLIRPQGLCNIRLYHAKDQRISEAQDHN